MNELLPTVRETKQLLGEKKSITPLWIIGLFVSLTELILGAAITQTFGGIQIALTVFVIAFPTITLVAFFMTLWRKNYVLYTPDDFDKPTVKDYVEAMQREPAINSFSLNQSTQQLTENDATVTNEIVDLFIERIDFNGLLCLYSFSLANKTMTPVDTNELAISLEIDYTWGILTSAFAVGLIDYTSSKEIVNIVHIDERLDNCLRTEIDKRFTKVELTLKEAGMYETHIQTIESKINLIEQYWG